MKRSFYLWLAAPFGWLPARAQELPTGLALEVGRALTSTGGWQTGGANPGQRVNGWGIEAWEIALAYTLPSGWRLQGGISPPHSYHIRIRPDEYIHRHGTNFNVQGWQLPVRVERPFRLGMFSRFSLGPQGSLSLFQRKFYRRSEGVSGGYNMDLNETYQIVITEHPLGARHRWMTSAGASLMWQGERLAIRLTTRHTIPLGRGDLTRATWRYESASRPQGVAYTVRSQLAHWSFGLSLVYQTKWSLRRVWRNRGNDPAADQ